MSAGQAKGGPRELVWPGDGKSPFRRGAARDVDFLKGVNWAFRGELLRGLGIDPRLRGAQR